MRVASRCKRYPRDSMRRTASRCQRPTGTGLLPHRLRESPSACPHRPCASLCRRVRLPAAGHRVGAACCARGPARDLAAQRQAEAASAAGGALPRRPRGLCAAPALAVGGMGHGACEWGIGAPWGQGTFPWRGGRGSSQVEPRSRLRDGASFSSMSPRSRGKPSSAPRPAGPTILHPLPCHNCRHGLQPFVVHATFQRFAVDYSLQGKRARFR